MLAEEVQQEECPDCGGRGWVIREDGGAGTAEPCGCRERSLGSKLLAAAEIPARYARCSLANFKTDLPDAAERDQLFSAHAVSRRYIEGFITDRGTFVEAGLIYIGPPGVGKTHLAVAVLTELISRYRVRGRFVDFTSLIHRIQSTFDPDAPDTKHGILQAVTDAEVLVLDELGAQKPSPWVTGILYLIMNSRYTNRLPTLFTTNLRLDRKRSGHSLDGAGRVHDEELLSRRIPGNLLSRLYEMARPVVMDVADFRREVKMHRHPF
jgi:DNA replication protein DnaC